MNANDRPQGPAVGGVGAHRNGTASTRTNGAPMGSYLRISGDAEQAAAELCEQWGPRFAASLALAIYELNVVKL